MNTRKIKSFSDIRVFKVDGDIFTIQYDKTQFPGAIFRFYDSRKLEK